MSESEESMQTTAKFAEIEELADVFTGHHVGLGSKPAKLMRGHAHEIAAAILAAGYRKSTNEYDRGFDDGHRAGQESMEIV